jgi:hypothetical protein
MKGIEKNMHFVDFNVVLLLNTPLVLHFVGDLDKGKIIEKHSSWVRIVIDLNLVNDNPIVSHH